MLKVPSSAHDMINLPGSALDSSAPAARTLKAMDWAQLHFYLQWIYRGKVAPDGRGRFAGCCGISAWYILRGEGIVHHEGAEKRARRGDWLFPARGLHDRDFSPGTEILSLRFYIEWPDGQPLFPLRGGAVLPGAKYPALLRRARELERAAGQGGRKSYSTIGFMNETLSFPAYLEVGGALLQWSKTLHHAFTSEGIHPSLERFEDERLVRALRLLDHWPLHEAFSQRRLVEQTGISRAQLDRLFTLKLGQTAHQYFNRRRLRHAERLVRLKDQPIKEVAFDVGFRHVSSFSAWFKQNTGVKPNERRETAADGSDRLKRARRR